MTKLSQTEKARRMLRRAGRRGVTGNAFLRAYIARFGARLADLRKEGLRIETEHVRGGCWKYTLRRRAA